MDASTKTFDTTSSAARKLGIPQATLVYYESRGVVGPFARDASGRRLLTEADVANVRAYLDGRRPKAVA